MNTDLVAFLKEQLQYHHHYNQQVIELLTTTGKEMPQGLPDLISHTINAHHIFNSRIESSKPLFQTWELHTMEKTKALDKENFDKTLSFLDNMDPLTLITYRAKGATFQHSIRDIVFHIVNHGTYHRGQIATACKQAGITPLATDYILYKMEGY